MFGDWSNEKWHFQFRPKPRQQTCPGQPVPILLSILQRFGRRDDRAPILFLPEMGRVPSTMRASTSRRVGLGFYNYRCESHKSYHYLLAYSWERRLEVMSSWFYTRGSETLCLSTRRVRTLLSYPLLDFCRELFL